MNARGQAYSKLTRKDLIAKIEESSKDKDILLSLLEEFEEITVSEVKHAKALKRLATSHQHLSNHLGFLSQVGEFHGE